MSAKYPKGLDALNVAIETDDAEAVAAIIRRRQYDGASPSEPRGISDAKIPQRDLQRACDVMWKEIKRGHQRERGLTALQSDIRRVWEDATAFMMR